MGGLGNDRGGRECCMALPGISKGWKNLRSTRGELPIVKFKTTNPFQVEKMSKKMSESRRSSYSLQDGLGNRYY